MGDNSCREGGIFGGGWEWIIIVVVIILIFFPGIFGNFNNSNSCRESKCD